MAGVLLQLLAIAYAIDGIVSAIAYWPTIKDLLNRTPSANTTSYVIWTITATITFLYSIFILSDGLFRFVSGMNFLACALIFILRMRLNVRQKKTKKRKPR